MARRVELSAPRLRGRYSPSCSSPRRRRWMSRFSLTQKRLRCWLGTGHRAGPAHCRRDPVICLQFSQ